MHPWIVWAREEMERRLHEPCVLEHLAATADLSLSRFTHLFAESEGVAPADYLHRLRLARAKVLLERTFLSVREVMALVGLSDVKRFEDDFRHAYGVAPRALRKQVWGGTMGER
jgi:transcriptional regulator GlxA family with amidase domain